MSCAECGRGICPDCMTYGPVGIRCPDHATAGGKVVCSAPRGAEHLAQALAVRAVHHVHDDRDQRRCVPAGASDRVGRSVRAPDGSTSTACCSGPAVADGDWWRLITAPFLHYGILHLGLNMLVLWFIGPPLEEYFGHWSYLLVYVVSGLAGSAGALIWSPNALTVGASGAIWGIMGAALVLEARRIWVFGGQAVGLVVINLAITFLVPGDLDRRSPRWLRRRGAVRARLLEHQALPGARHALDGRRRRARASAVAVAQSRLASRRSRPP